MVLSKERKEGTEIQMKIIDVTERDKGREIERGRERKRETEKEGEREEG